MLGRRLWVASAVAAAASATVLAGCGGSARPPATASPARPTASQRLQAYFEAMKTHERQFNSLSDRVVGALDLVDVTRPGATWLRAAARLDPVTSGFDELGVAIAKVQPPPDLAEVHQRLAEATVAFSEYVFALQQALAIEIPQQLERAATADTTAIKQARGDWAKALKRYAARLGVIPPEWLAPSPAA